MLSKMCCNIVTYVNFIVLVAKCPAFSKPVYSVFTVLVNKLNEESCQSEKILTRPDHKPVDKILHKIKNSSC